MNKYEIDYYSKDFIQKFSGLQYGDYETCIIGNTFYIERKTKFGYKDEFSIVMVKMHYLTLLDILTSYNFDTKYNWIYKEMLDIENMMDQKGV